MEPTNQTTTERIPLFADTYQPEVFAILTELVDGYRADTIETLEGIRSALFCLNGVGQIHELPPAVDLQVLALRMSLAKDKVHKYLRAQQALAGYGHDIPVRQQRGLNGVSCPYKEA